MINLREIPKKKYFLFATGFYSSKEFLFIVYICLPMQKQKMFIKKSFYLCINCIDTKYM